MRIEEQQAVLWEACLRLGFDPGRWPGHQPRRMILFLEKLCPVHRAACDERAGGPGAGGSEYNH
jgi:hypothetical protein